MYLEGITCGLESLNTICVCALYGNVVVKVRHLSVVSEESRVHNEIVETEMTGSQLLDQFREMIEENIVAYGRFDPHEAQSGVNFGKS